jgi:hypothetical protein
LKTLKDLVPEEVRDAVGNLKLRGGRNYSIAVEVKPTFLDEVLGIWKEHMEAKEITFNGNQLRAHAERSPAQRNRYAKLGKVKEFAENNYKGSYNTRVFWAPEYSVYLEPKDNQNALFLAEVGSKGEIQWDETTLNKIGSSIGEASAQFAQYRRK